MRTVLAAACILALGAAPALAQAVPGWRYAYESGAAVATHTDDEGDLVATISCRPPDGVMVLTDHKFGRRARGADVVAVRIGQMTINVPARAEGRGGNARLLIDLPQRPPVLAGVQPDDALSVTVGDVTHSYGRGSGRQMEQVAYACWAGQ